MEFNKEEAEFFEIEYKQILNDTLLRVEDYVQKNKKELKNLFCNAFQKALPEIQLLSEKSFPIAYLTFTLLRTNLMNHDFNYVIKIYDENWYFGRPWLNAGVFDAEPIFFFYEEMLGKLIKESKKYFGKVKNYHLESMSLQEISKWNQYIASIARYSILDCIQMEDYERINKNNSFAIQTGEYQDAVQIIHKEKKEKLPKEELKKIFNKKEKIKYCFEDYTGTDIKNADFRTIDFRYTDLRNGNFSNSDFEQALLIGARLKNSNMENCNFKYAKINEVNLENCSLTKADFRYCTGSSGIENTLKWEMAGYFEVSLKNADLREADFSYSELNGADFTGACLDGTKFNYAGLTNAKFSESEKSNINLSAEQKKEIIWIPD